MVKSYEELDVWQNAMEQATLVYDVTQVFPAEERFGLTSQLRRAAVSVPSNIAEGQGRRSAGEFLNQLSIARGSLMEVETQLELARRLGILADDDHKVLNERTRLTGRLLNGLIRVLQPKGI